MNKNPSPLLATTALYLGQILSHQEEIIRLLSEIKIQNGDSSDFAERILNARNNSEKFVSQIMNRYLDEMKEKEGLAPQK